MRCVVSNEVHYFGDAKPGDKGRACQCGEKYAVPVWANSVPRRHVGWNVTEPHKPLEGEETGK